MARTNRIVIDNGVYHITSRIVSQQFLLQDSALKDEIVTWIYGIADFSGINVLSWCIMNNHFHLLVHVPPVPEKYWKNAEIKPETSAFSMRPRENTCPRWTPDICDCIEAITPAGDMPSEEAIRKSISEGVPLVRLPRPQTDFMLSDEEMLCRIKRLYDGCHSRFPSIIKKRWVKMRENGQDDLVDEEKVAYCRRMYNVSQFVKTLKQRISQKYNKANNHSGHLWSDRFYSGLVENELKAKIAVAAYIDWNAPRAKLTSHAKEWKWCSFACASGNNIHTERARKGYELIFDATWEEAKERMERIFSAKVETEAEDAKIPEEHSHSVNKRKYAGLFSGRMKMHHLIHSKQKALSGGKFIATNRNFVGKIIKILPTYFKIGSTYTLDALVKVDWREPKATGHQIA